MAFKAKIYALAMDPIAECLREDASPSKEDAEQRQIGCARNQQRYRQRRMNSLASGLADDAHGGKSIGRFYPESPT